MGILAWIIVGLIAGWLAGQVMKGGLRRGRRHHSWTPRRGPRRLDLREAGSLNGWRHDRLNHCRLYRRCDFGRDYPLVKASLKRVNECNRLFSTVGAAFPLALTRSMRWAVSSIVER